MPTRIWRGDAPETAKVLRVVRPDYDAPIVFDIGNKTLSFGAFDAGSIVASWNASDFPELAAITASAEANGDVLLTADEPGVLFDVTVTSPAVVTVETLQQGRAAVDQQTRLTVPSAASGGTFTITVDGQTTSGIAYNAAASAVQTALEALSNVASGDALVSGDAGGPYLITFTQAFSGDAVTVTASGAALTGVAAIDIDVIQSPGNQIKEIQGVTVSAPFALSNEPLAITLQDGAGGSVDLDDVDDLQAGLDALYGAGVVTILINTLVTGAVETGEPGRFMGALVLQWADPSVARELIQVSIAFGLDPAVCQTSRLQAAGAGSNHELWTVAFDFDASETFTLTHDGNTTAAISRDGASTDIETALEALASITDVTVTHASNTTQGMIAFVAFVDDDANEPDLTATGDFVTVAKIKDGGPLLNTIQRLEVTAAAGTFTLSDGVDTTDPIAYNASAATIKADLEADITAIDSVTVSGAFPVWNLEFAGGQAATNVAALIGDASSLVGGQNPTAATVTSAVAPRNEQQQVTLSGNVGGGTFTLTHGTATTAAIDHDETAAALEALFDTALGSGTTSVSGVPGGPYLVTFTGSLAAANQQQLEADASALTTAGSGAQVEQVTRSRGPNHIDDPLNWTGDGPVDSGDTLIFERGAVDALWGLTWSSAFTAEADDEVLTLAEKADFHNHQAVRVWTDGGTLPSGLSADTNYFVRNFNREQQTLQLSATEGGAAINLTSDGSGALYVGVAIAQVQIYQRYSGQIGLPVFSIGGYYEYLRRHWRFATTDPSGAENVIIGKGPGPGSGLIRLDVAADHELIGRVYNTGGSLEDDQPACQLLTDDVDSTLVVEGGTVGVAVLHAQASTLATVEARGAGEIHLGPNCNVTNVRTATGGTVTADESNSGALALDA